MVAGSLDNQHGNHWCGMRDDATAGTASSGASSRLQGAENTSFILAPFCCGPKNIDNQSRISHLQDDDELYDPAAVSNLQQNHANEMEPNDDSSFPIITGPMNEVQVITNNNDDNFLSTTAQTYAPYLKVEIPRVLVVLNDKGGGSQNEEPQPFRKVVYVSQLRDPKYNNGKPSLFLLRKIVARTMWQMLLQEQEQEGRDKSMDEEYLSSLLETALHVGGTTTDMEQDLPPSFCLKYQGDDGELVELEDDGDLKDALRHPPKGGLRTRLVYDPSNENGKPTKKKHKRKKKKRESKREERDNTESLFRIPMAIDGNANETKDDLYVCEGNIPYYSVDEMDEPFTVHRQAIETGNRHINTQSDIPQIELSLHRRPDAVVRLDIDYLYDDYENISYWRLIEAAAQVFHIQSVEHVTLFYVAPSFSPTAAAHMHIIANDVDLSKQLATGAAEATGSRQPLVHHIRVIDSTVLISKPDGTHLQVPYSSFMDDDGHYSFPKLLNCARMAHPTQPVKALTYLSPRLSMENGRSEMINPNSGNIPGKIYLMNSSEVLENAFQNHLPTTQHVTMHPVFQATPLKLPAAAATFLLGDCSIAEDPPRVRMIANNSVVGWDMSSLVPGRYRVSIDYYRGTASGSVYIHAGVIPQYPDNPSADDAAEQCRKSLPQTTIFLTATGSDPYDPRHFGDADVGDFEITGGENMTNEYFVIAAEKLGKPLMSIKTLICTYLGI
ncbi:hypothetical protein ACA910_012534 [Epithemia clementina (nom. ined.)]